MQEAFTRNPLSACVDEVGPCVRASVLGWPTDQPLRVYPQLKRLTLDIATQVFMGGRGGADTARINGAFVPTVLSAAGTGHGGDLFAALCHARR